MSAAESGLGKVPVCKMKLNRTIGNYAFWESGEKDFCDYILIFPILNMPPVHVYLSKLPVKPLAVGEYHDLAGRSCHDEMNKGG
ncbi:hypothetical protein BB987_19635 [Photorhabdus temperata]|uniref:Uncharacterized protein n=1 Tax=Photorhabdus khanii NC19 TaxID=1004151 RepID=W3V540_9GAMM|nr:hypothetical protein PTE_03579 [Photorhabdus khanii NC19]OHV49397.1 hypothetical protein BB987_19635 [Photorhabdus temperata]